MSKQKKLGKGLELQMSHSENGRPPEESISSESPKQEVDSTMLKPLSKIEKKTSKKKKEVISTAESQVQPKKKILKDKSTSSKKSTRVTKLSKTLLVLSTLNEKDLTKYWLSQSKDLSKKLWLPTETGYVGSHGNTSTGCLNSTELISSSKINRNILQKPSSAKICSQSSMYSPHDTTVLGGNILLKSLQKAKLKKLNRQETLLHNKLIKKDKDRIKKVIIEDDINNFIVKAKRIQVLPLNNSSRKTINDGIAVHRKIWNCCATEVQKNPELIDKNKKIKGDDKKDSNANYLRDKFVVYKNMTESKRKELDWTFRIQQKVREAVTRRFLANYETAKKNLEVQTRKFFYKLKKSKKKKNKKRKIKKKITMHFKNRTDEKQSIYLSKEICKFRICEKTKKTILETFNGIELALQEDYTNFSLVATCDRCHKTFDSSSALTKHKGIKKPCIKVSKEDAKLIPKTGVPHTEIILQRIGFNYYIYVPEYSNPKIKMEAPNEIISVDAGWNTLLTYYSPDGEWGEICPGIKDKIQLMRNKITYLKQLDKRGKSKKKAINKRLLRITNMIDDLHWKVCHWLLSKFRKIIISRLYVTKCSKDGKQTQADLRLCSFVDRLIHKSIEYKNSEIHICKEHNTSKACTMCLSLNTVKDKTVKCHDCNHEIHRDLNGARNIFLKHCY